MMKRETIIKKLRRYAKSLAFMENEAMQADKQADAEHYRNDKLAFEESINIIERSNA